MSRYLELHNSIKTHATLDWMTPSQQQVLSAIQNLLYSYRVINLYGYRGCGKTFLGWMCHRESIGFYVPHPSLLQCHVSSLSSSCLIVDNVQDNRAAFRDILKEVQIFSVPNLIVISQPPIREEIVALELHCTAHDYERASHNLSLDNQGQKIDSGMNLWHIFYSKCNLE
jgi:hypothetical protein